MSLSHLTTPSKIVDAIERQGTLGWSVEPMSKAALAADEAELSAAMRAQGVSDPKWLIDATQEEIAKRGDAGGLYVDGDRQHALRLLREESKAGKNR